MDEVEQILMELDGLRRSVGGSYWPAVIEDVKSLILNQKKSLDELSYLDGEVSQGDKIIADNATMIERERCARVAESYKHRTEGFNESEPDKTVFGWGRARTGIADKIRKGT